jgi:hypothetical protein
VTLRRFPEGTAAKPRALSVMRGFRGEKLGYHS